MPVLQVFDPPMCCSTGVCGPSVDPVLPRFAADLDWLRSQGVRVERCNLAQSPEVVARTGVVLKLLQDSPDTALPAVLVDGGLVHHGSYPERAALAAWAGLPAPTPVRRGLPIVAAAAPGEGCCS